MFLQSRLINPFARTPPILLAEPGILRTDLRTGTSQFRRASLGYHCSGFMLEGET